jgi:hypothetical protein
MIPEFPFFDEIKIMQQCPICDAKFARGMFTLLGGKTNNYFLHVQCSSCLQSVLILIGFADHGTSVIALVTDLDKNEVVRMCKKNNISQNDVLDFTNIMKNNNKFTQLFDIIYEKNKHK